MRNNKFTLVLAAALCGISLPALAQQADTDKGIYGVGRVGATFGTGQKLGSLPDRSAFSADSDYKPGITGELGIGYDFGLFRVEQTAGYTQFKPKASSGAIGNTDAFTVSVAGYVDIPTGTRFEPYVGAGAGAARVQARAAQSANSLSSAYNGKDWGFLWHADAGVGYRLTSKMTVEVGGRYSQIGSLSFSGQNNTINTTYHPKLNTWSGAIGLRYRF
ncbi:outer membrane protein [Novosphingobium sediminicola]|uniref:Opacity protein-like surface antigen n=1 Tax=Novosphingobium sediminicola TaxID=563162 RepID=A0A7W6CML6_9SPHN|nr:OmpW family outer membrane protein [Novosphingobium sediminicola]MBB3957188.1 opacity protein-like surface antigen [Novosphingobium sediminicola]